MIYAIKYYQGIKILDHPRQRDLEATKLIYTWEISEKLVPDLIKYLRPWRKLDIQNDYVFKDSSSVVFQRITPDLLEKQAQRTYITKEEIEIILFEYNKFAEILRKLGKITTPNPELNFDLVDYRCDIPNLLESWYGPEEFRYLEKLYNLQKEKQSILIDFSRIGVRERALEFLSGALESIEDPTDIMEFLDPWYKTNLIIFGELGENINQQNIPEFKNKTGLSEKENLEHYLRREVHETFNLGDQVDSKTIKEVLGKLYIKYGIEKEPRAIDIYNYFNASFTCSGKYRLDTRK